MTETKKRGLGKGLSALLGDTPEKPAPAPASSTGTRTVPIEQLKPNRHQPRKVFDDDVLAELASSIRQHGILQPILVRTVQGGYEIIAGERRWRAAQRAGLFEVPVVAREANDEQSLEMAIVENVQRADLNAIEEAKAYDELVAFGLTQGEVAEKTGKSREAVANTLRLLKLPAAVQDLIEDGAISEGHGRALCGAVSLGEERVVALARTAAGGAKTVRALEREVRALVQQQTESKPAAREVPVEERYLVNQLQTVLKTRVDLQQKNGKGKMVLHFHSHAELERLTNILKNGSRE